MHKVNIAIGWLDINDRRHYFTKDSLMVSGKWLEIDGSLAKSTKVDGYEVDASGVKKSKLQ